MRPWRKILRFVLNERGDFGGGDEEKEAQRQEDIARQREEVQNIGNQFLAQLNPNSPEFNEFQSFLSEMVSRSAEGPFAVSQLGGAVVDQQEAVRRFGEQLVQQQSARIAAGGPAGPLEERTNLAFEAFRDISKRTDFEEDVFRLLSGEEPQTAFGKQFLTGLSPSDIEQDLLNALTGQPTTTPVGRVFEQEVARLSGGRVPDTVFEDALKLVEDRVNEEFAARGALGGGLRLEGLGRAGVEAAIAEVLRQDALRQQAFQNITGLFDTGRAIPANIRDLFSSVFNAGEGLRGREIGVEAALRDIQLGRETNLTDIINRNVGTRLSDLSSLLQRRTSRAENISDFFTELAESDERALRQAATDVAVAAAGGQGGSRAFSVPSIQPTSTAPTSQPLTVDDLIAATRTPDATTGGSRFQPLSRQPQEEERLRLLFKLLAQ